MCHLRQDPLDFLCNHSNDLLSPFGIIHAVFPLIPLSLKFGNDVHRIDEILNVCFESDVAVLNELSCFHGTFHLHRARNEHFQLFMLRSVSRFFCYSHFWRFHLPSLANIRCFCKKINLHKFFGKKLSFKKGDLLERECPLL